MSEQHKGAKNIADNIQRAINELLAEFRCKTGMRITRIDIHEAGDGHSHIVEQAVTLTVTP